MHAVLLSNGGLRALPAVLSPAKLSIHGKKIADAAPRGEQLRWSPNSCIIRSEGNRRGRRPPRPVSADKPREEESGELNQRSQSSGNEEILALFRRIQSSISKEGEAKLPRRRRRNYSIPKEQQHSADSVSSVLEKQPRRNQPGTEKRRESEEDGSVLKEDSKAPRPLSKFVRRSPIPVAPPSEERSTGDVFEKQSSVNKVDDNERVQDVEEIKAASDVFELQKIEDMKLPELKELARDKGIKGFSRLKKGELLQVLKQRLQSSA